MSSCNDVTSINQSSTANVNRLLRILLQDSRLPWILSELAVAIDVRWILDSPVDSLRVSDSALLELVALLLEWRLINRLLLLLLVRHAIRLLTAANSSRPALLWLLIISLSLIKKTIVSKKPKLIILSLPFQHSKRVLQLLSNRNRPTQGFPSSQCSPERLDRCRAFVGCWGRKLCRFLQQSPALELG